MNEEIEILTDKEKNITSKNTKEYISVLLLSILSIVAVIYMIINMK